MAIKAPDPRIDADFPGTEAAAWIIQIVQDLGPITKVGIVAELEKARRDVPVTYLKHVMTRLRQFGIIAVTRKNVENYAWVFVPYEPAARKSGVRVVLRHAGAYRVRTHDGLTFERLEFDRPSVTFFNRKVQLGIEDISEVAYIPDHAAFKSGSKHIDVYSHDFVDVEDCILPKRKPSDDTSPKWVHPIRARALGISEDEPLPKFRKPFEMDYGDPRR
jgi:hypothetical protein